MPTRTIFGLTLMLLLLPVYSVLTGCTVGYGYPAQPVYGYAYGNGYYANGYYAPGYDGRGYAPAYYNYGYAPNYGYAYPRYGYGYGHVGPMYRPPTVVYGPGSRGGGQPYFHGGGHAWGHR